MFNLAKLKIVFIAGTLGQGGAERQLFYILKCLKDHGTTLKVLCLTKNEYWQSQIEKLDIPVICVGESKSKLARLWNICKIILKDKPHVVQSQHFYTNLYAAIAGKLNHIPSIGAVRGDGKSELGGKHRGLRLLSLKIPNRIAVNSKAALKYIITKGLKKEKAFFLKNVIDADRFSFKENKENKELKIGFIGRLSSEKRADRFLKVLKNITEKKSNITGLIVGDGPELVALQKLATELGLLKDKVIFQGIVSDIEKMYREIDILVLTSDYEGTPNVVLEAMVSGIPVICFGVGDLPDLIEHGKTGYLSSRGDEESMTKMVLEIIDDSKKRLMLGENAANFIMKNYSLANLSGQLKGLYQEVI